MQYLSIIFCEISKNEPNHSCLFQLNTTEVANGVVGGERENL